MALFFYCMASEYLSIFISDEDIAGAVKDALSQCKKVCSRKERLPIETFRLELEKILGWNPSDIRQIEDHRIRSDKGNSKLCCYRIENGTIDIYHPQYFIPPALS